MMVHNINEELILNQGLSHVWKIRLIIFIGVITCSC